MASRAKQDKVLRVLALHGSRTNPRKWKHAVKDELVKLGVSSEKFLVELFFAPAPLRFVNQASETTKDLEEGELLDIGIGEETRCWWTPSCYPETMIYAGLEESIAYLETFWRIEGPFDGVFGFSQGAALVGILAGLQHEGRLENINFKFAIFMSGFSSRDTREKFAKIVKDRPTHNLISLPTFHSWGLEDKLVDPTRSEDLTKAFAHPKVVTHGSGHFSKALKYWPIDEMGKWLDSLDFEPSSSLTSSLDTLRDRLVASKRRMQLSTASVVFPLGLKFPGLLEDKFFQESICENPKRAALEFNGISFEDIEAFVKRSFDKHGDEVVLDLYLIALTLTPSLYQFPLHLEKHHRLTRGDSMIQMLAILIELKGIESFVENALPLIVDDILQEWVLLTRLLVFTSTGTSLSQKPETVDLVPMQDRFSSLHEPLADAIAKIFKEQLLGDFSVVNAMGEVEMDYDAIATKKLDLEMDSKASWPSKCAFAVPNRRSHTAKATKIFQKLRELIWQEKKLDLEEIVHVIKDFHAKFSLEQVQLLRGSKTGTRRWLGMSKDEWLALRNTEISHGVVHPEPMPVTISAQEQLQPLYDFLASNKQLEDVTHRKNGANIEVTFERGTIVSDKRLDLCKQVIGPQGVSPLIESLRQDAFGLGRVQHLLLGNNIAGNGLGEGIAEFLDSGKCHLTTFYLAGNRMDVNGIAPLAKSLSNNNNNKVVQLWLKRNPLGPAGGKAIGENLLRLNNTLRVLDLSFTGLLDAGAKAVFDNITEASGLEVLFMDVNGITEASLDSICSAIERPTKLNALGIGGNRLHDKGAQRISKALLKNVNLVRLGLESAGIGAAGATAIAEVLNQTNVKWLSFGLLKSTLTLKEIPNRIENEGAISLAKMLRRNKTLEGLDITYNWIGEDGMRAILEVLEAKPDSSLRKLQFKQNGHPLNDITAEKLRAIVGKNKLKVLKKDSIDKVDWVDPPFLDEVSSVYRVGSKYPTKLQDSIEDEL